MQRWQLALRLRPELFFAQTKWGQTRFFSRQKAQAPSKKRKKTGLTPSISVYFFDNRQSERGACEGANQNRVRPVFSTAKRGGCRRKNGSDPEFFREFLVPSAPQFGEAGRFPFAHRQQQPVAAPLNGDARLSSCSSANVRRSRRSSACILSIAVSVSMPCANPSDSSAVMVPSRRGLW